jgi:DNA-binding phage protein
MAKKKPLPFDAADFLDDAQSQADLLADAFETGNATYIANALGVVAQHSARRGEGAWASALGQANVALKPRGPCGLVVAGVCGSEIAL